MPDTTPTPQLAEVRVTLRIPSILAAKVGKAVGERRKEWRKYSMNDWLCEAIREKLDGPSIPVADIPYNPPVERRPVPNIPVAAQAYAFPEDLEPLGYSSVGDGGAIGQRLNEDLGRRKKAWDRASTRETGDADIDEFLLSEGRQKPPGWAKWGLPRRKAWFLTSTSEFSPKTAPRAPKSPKEAHLEASGGEKTAPATSPELMKAFKTLLPAEKQVDEAQKASRSVKTDEMPTNLKPSEMQAWKRAHRL